MARYDAASSRTKRSGLSLRLGIGPALQLGQITGRRLAHDHEARPSEMLDEAFCGDPGHQLVPAMRALAAIKAQREGERLLDVLRDCGVRRGSDGIGSSGMPSG